MKNYLNMFWYYAKFLLLPFAFFYGIIIEFRNYLYAKNILSSIEFDIPTVCVGNLSVGGTGKTPHIEYLIRLFEYQYKIATLSRGYGRKTNGFRIAQAQDTARELGDEPFQFFTKFKDITVSVGENRSLAIPELLQQKPDTEVVLLDDAFQHRGVKAGLNIVLTTFDKPYFADYILPFGTLREGKNAIKRAEIVVVTKCPQNLAEINVKQWRDNLMLDNHQHLFFSVIKYKTPQLIFTQANVDVTMQTELMLLAGIAQPQHLVNYIKPLCNYKGALIYPDHYNYTNADIQTIIKNYQEIKAENKLILTTEKDAARLMKYADIFLENKIQIAMLPIEIDILCNQTQEFNSLIFNYMEQALQQYNNYE